MKHFFVYVILWIKIEVEFFSVINIRRQGVSNSPYLKQHLFAFDEKYIESNEKECFYLLNWSKRVNSALNLEQNKWIDLLIFFKIFNINAKFDIAEVTFTIRGHLLMNPFSTCFLKALITPTTVMDKTWARLSNKLCPEQVCSICSDSFVSISKQLAFCEKRDQT